VNITDEPFIVDKDEAVDIDRNVFIGQDNVLYINVILGHTCLGIIGFETI